MGFNKKLLDIIACPVCKGQLVLSESNSEDNTDAEKQGEQVLVCRFDRLEYRIEDGIPVLLETESRRLSSEELEQVKSHD